MQIDRLVKSSSEVKRKHDILINIASNLCGAELADFTSKKIKGKINQHLMLDESYTNIINRSFAVSPDSIKPLLEKKMETSGVEMEGSLGKKISTFEATVQFMGDNQHCSEYACAHKHFRNL